MKAHVWLLGSALLLVAACDDIALTGAAPGRTDGFMSEIPEGVLAVVAPNQNLNAVRVNESDGCYVYQYAGPVETTLLPLRTRDGRPICTRASEVPVEDTPDEA